MKKAQKSQLSMIEKHYKAARGGDISYLARLLTLSENNVFDVLKFLSKQEINKSALRLGITGPPGAGKSSLVNLLIKELRLQKLKVAVIAIDPSSPFSGGALLGDRVRMSEHAEDKNVFIRSQGSRGGFGGLSAATGVMARIFEACGFDIIIIETVGVGQTELEIMNLADATTVVLVPESGDVIQTLKAGILEIADVFVVNKSDRPGADILSAELKNLTEQEATVRAVLTTSALKNEGVSSWAETIINLAKKKNINANSMQKQNLLKGELKSLVLFEINKKIQLDLGRIKKISTDNYFKEAVKLLNKYNK